MPTPKQIAANLFRAYEAGWTDGALVRPMDGRMTSDPDIAIRNVYDLGYANGLRDRRQALDTAAARYGHVRDPN